MKTQITLIILLFSFINLNGQDLKDSRVVYSKIGTYTDANMLEAWDDSSTLTAKEEKKYLEWQARFKSKMMDKLIEKSDTYLSEKGAKVQPLETAGEFGMMAMTVEGYPNIVFPKKALKKKGEKLDVGDYFISYFISFDKGGASPSLKGYSPAFELEVKVFNKKGEKIKDFKTKGVSEKKMGVVSMKVKKDYFSRTDFESIDWIMETFGPALDAAIENAMSQIME